MNSKWKIHRIGLIDFWYYDEEEFYFLDGRMLLRGANGSGKSVTMQSFIPLLLDGNMRPERLDPFGSRARKMENYLLEEGDEREERTGYLYMEFKRQDSDTYLTIGIGMRARKNKKLDAWYFCITDGRRIGKDFLLYKDVENKIVFTKTELRNRIGEGGKVMETQREYVECVNRLLFGFETPEEYKEMLELLIQLRTPKLSKDFKPTVINDILSSSLQTLSEDDLRPMSEAIENMDSLKTNLDTLKDSVRAAKQIERVYNQYNQVVLYDKALLFTNAENEYKKSQRLGTDFQNQIVKSQGELEKERQHYEELASEEEILKKQEQSLNASDAKRLKEEEQQLLKTLDGLKQEVAEKGKQLSEKTERRLDTENKLKKQTQKNEIAWDTIEEKLEEMEATLADIPFDEFAFMKKELEEKPEETYNFHAHSQLLQKYTSQVEKGVEVLEEERQHKERYGHLLQESDELNKVRDASERSVRQYENQLQEIKGELKEKIYQWARNNVQLKPAEENLRDISVFVEAFSMGDDYSEVKEKVRASYHKVEDELREEQARNKREKEELQKQMNLTSAELKEWEEKKDPEPEQPESVKQSRALLEKKGIPFMQFYKMVDFDRTLTKEQTAALEEALLQTGILDALIVSSEYREQVRELEQGACDKYIFSDVTHVKENLIQALDVDNGSNDILLYQKVSNILSAIGWGAGEEAGSTWIDAEGNYRLGILEGTVTKVYEPRYIGVQARENYRRQRIKELTGLLSELAGEMERMLKQEETLNQNRTSLMAEWNAFPAGEDLKIAAKALDERENELSNLMNQIAKLQDRLTEERKLLEEVRLQVQEVCQKTYLTVRLDVFRDALQDLKMYKDDFTEIQLIHGTYRNGIQIARGHRQYLEDIDQDLDDIRYESGRIQKKLKDANGLYQSVVEQMKLTNYEEIKEQLDHCVTRLKSIPKEREDATKCITQLEENIKTKEAAYQENEQTCIRLSDRCKRAGRAFEMEYKLGYVKREFVITEDMSDQAGKVCGMLTGQFGNRKQSDYLGSLQEMYHQNRADLLEYNLTITTLFGELDEESSVFEVSMKRVDITAKYRGVTVRFPELIEKLEKDVEEQTNLLSEKDRELFEDILANTISKKIRGKIQSSKRWVEKMNQLMESMQTSSGLKLNLRWKSKRADKEEQLDTRALVDLLQKDAEIMREEEVERMSRHFRSKIEEARRIVDDTSSAQSFHMIMREVLDYRKWFEFQLECQKTGEKKKELTDRVFFTFSGGEKAMAMYVPLFSAVVAKYAGARTDAPRLISLDEAFAGVDEMNIKDMFRLMVEFEFNFMINSQILWGDYETVPALAIYQLIRPENAKYVTVIPYVWNGKVRIMADKTGDEIAG